MNVNVITVSGRLTSDPKVFDAGTTKVCKFSIANHPPRLKDTVWFFECEAWGKTGEIIGDKFKKGSKILIEGRLKQDKYKGKDGDVSKIVINVNDFDYADSLPASERNATRVGAA